MGYQGYHRLTITRDNGVLTIVMDRPEALNAMDAVLHKEIAKVFYEAGHDDEVRAMVLTGAGRAFSAGGDIGNMQRQRHVDDVRRIFSEAYEILQNIINAPQPVIAAVNGPAIGLGCTLALYCDLIIASEKATFADPHVRVGLVAGDGGAGIWPFVVGPARAKQYLLTGDPLDARTALEIGLINEVVPPEALTERAVAWARRLADLPRFAVQMTKRSINRWVRMMMDHAVEPSLMIECVSFFDPEHRQAVQAFMEQRRWKHS